MSLSLPTWERELKHPILPDDSSYPQSLPTWERELKRRLVICLLVPNVSYRSLRGSVSWNVVESLLAPLAVGLLPTWERELKRVWATILLLRRKSLPVWERELKPSLLKCFAAAIYYRFLHGSVSWNSDKTFKSETLSALMILRNSLVAPYVGACVEINVQY